MLLRLLPLAVLLLLAAPHAWAQGSIAGRVVDAQFGDPLPGVNVIIQGTDRGAATDLDGRFLIPNLRPDEYNVRVSYIGFETKLLTGIRVETNETTDLEIELAEAVLSTEDEVVIVGERPLIDVEQSASTSAVSREEIEAAPLRDVQDVVATQAGVVRDPTGLYIRGGRANETGFVVDGVSAKDPLAGTGFGLDMGSNAFEEVEVTTGGIGAEYGDVTSGVVAVTTRDGGDTFSGFLLHKRDNFGFNEDARSNFRQDLYEANLGGPIIPGTLTFFTSAQVQLMDDFTRFTSTPDNLQTSLTDTDWLTPRAHNRWSGMGKLTWRVRQGMRLQASYQRSFTANQNTRMLQVTGNDDTIRPGFQYAFALQPNRANTFAHDNVVTYLKWSHVLGDRSFYEIQASRLFTRLRADANGRAWRPQQVDSELDPESIPEYPADIFRLSSDAVPLPEGAEIISAPREDVLYILPGPGLYNNGGIATRWHDHFAEELTLKSSYTRFMQDEAGRTQLGLELKFNDYQWIDIVRPWVGAPIGEGEQTNRLGESADIWHVQPNRGAVYGTQQLRYRGLIANLGVRFEYWQPGSYVDDLVQQRLDYADAVDAGTPPEELPVRVPILESVAQQYQDESLNLFGNRTKFRLLPKIGVSFPIRENQVLYFNYGHSTRLPHPTFLYAGLDPYYQDRSFFASLGNPNLDPEVDISYEVGLKYQITNDDALELTAFWRDKYDFITVQDVLIPDATGRETARAFRINGDFARVRGLEASYVKRFGDWLMAQVSGSFSRATGLSSTNDEAVSDYLADGNVDNTFETPLAWDRPLDLKAILTYTHERDEPAFGVPGLNNFQVYLQSTFRSGRRYTPVEFVGYEVHPFAGAVVQREVGGEVVTERIPTRCDASVAPGDRLENYCWRPSYESVTDPEDRYSEIGEPWWWFDLTIKRDIDLGATDLRLTLEIQNLFNQDNGVVPNPVTGAAYPDGDPRVEDRSYDVTAGVRDPRFEDPNTTGLPPFNPARYMAPRHVVFGLSYRF